MAASRILISYPEDLSGWGRLQLDTPWFKAYLRKTLDTPEPGATREEFLDVGCCGNTLTVPLRIEQVDNGTTIDDNTRIEFTNREACGIQGGWRVQSAAGPTTNTPTTQPAP